jgi:hypothetical protein
MNSELENISSINDHLEEIINTLKSQYRKYSQVRGLPYDIIISKDKRYIRSDHSYGNRKSALDLLVKNNVIKSYTQYKYIASYDTKIGKGSIDSNLEQDLFVCFISEDLLIGGDKIVKIEHIHKFENSIQEKDIILVQKEKKNKHVNIKQKHKLLQIKMKKKGSGKFLITVNNGTAMELANKKMWNDLYKFIHNYPKYLNKEEYAGDFVSNLNKQTNTLQKEITKVLGKKIKILKLVSETVTLRDEIEIVK